MNIHRQIKRKRIEEGLWDDVKNKAKSLVGKGKKEFDAPSIIKLQSKGSFFRAMKDVLLFTKEEVLSGKSGNISFNFPGIYKENSENMYQYFNSLGISYNPKILDMWKKYGLEVKNFYKLFLNNPNKYNSNDILMEHEVFEYLGIKLPLINNDFGSKAIQNMLELLINDPIDRNSLNTYFNRKLSKITDLNDKVTNIKEDASYIKELDYRLETAFKYLLSFIKKKVKEQFDSLIYIPETIDAKKYSRIKDELYRFFKYFYPNDSIQEITKKLGISKKDNLYYNKDNLPTEDFMKSSMATKEKTLKNYLQKKLTVSPKEAELLESVIKEYVKKKKKVKEVSSRETWESEEYSPFYSDDEEYASDRYSDDEESESSFHKIDLAEYIKDVKQALDPNSKAMKSYKAKHYQDDLKWFTKYWKDLKVNPDRDWKYMYKIVTGDLDPLFDMDDRTYAGDSSIIMNYEGDTRAEKLAGIKLYLDWLKDPNNTILKERKLTVSSRKTHVMESVAKKYVKKNFI